MQTNLTKLKPEKLIQLLFHIAYRSVFLFVPWGINFFRKNNLRKKHLRIFCNLEPLSEKILPQIFSKEL